MKKRKMQEEIDRLGHKVTVLIELHEKQAATIAALTPPKPKPKPKTWLVTDAALNITEVVADRHSEYNGGLIFWRGSEPPRLFEDSPDSAAVARFANYTKVILKGTDNDSTE